MPADLMGRAGRPGRLSIGYLQVGPPEHGICRYGRLLAAEGRRRPDVAVLEESVQLSGEESRDLQLIRAAATRLSRADVVHVQVGTTGDRSWGRNRRALQHLRSFRRACRAPVVFTLHDINGLTSLPCRGPLSALRWAVGEAPKGPIRPVARLLRRLTRPEAPEPPSGSSWWNVDPVYPWLVARWVTRTGSLTFVLSATERDVLASMGLGERAVLIPHFVEDPPPDAAPPAAARAGPRTVVLAGFVFGAKGHELMIEALALLPDVNVALVGGNVRAARISPLLELATRRGVADRIQLTGYLPEDEYQRRLTAADLAVCPFTADKSASGSVSSLIAAGCPILASDIPVIREYNAMVPGAIATFTPYTPEALASAVRTLLQRPRGELTEGLAELRRRLSIATIYDRHLESYRRVLASRPAASA